MFLLKIQNLSVQIIDKSRLPSSYPIHPLLPVFGLALAATVFKKIHMVEQSYYKCKKFMILFTCCYPCELLWDICDFRQWKVCWNSMLWLEWMQTKSCFCVTENVIFLYLKICRTLQGLALLGLARKSLGESWCWLYIGQWIVIIFDFAWTSKENTGEVKMKYQQMTYKNKVWFSIN